MNNETMEKINNLDEKRKQDFLNFVQFLNSQDKKKSPHNIQEELTSLFRQLPKDSQKEALAAMEHINEYDNMNFHDYRDEVCEVANKIDNLRVLFGILADHFIWNKSIFEKDPSQKALFIHSYPKMQTLINVMFNITFDLAKTTDVLAMADIHELKRA